MELNVLVVDLDGTLIKTDLLVESASDFISRNPLRLLHLAPWLGAGKAILKAKLAECSEIDPALLPYNEGLVEWLRGQKAAGRYLVLATASHKKLADVVACHLNLFDEVVATDGDLNLKAGQKRDVLVSRFGAGGYDYVGDCYSDLPVWKSANKSYVVSSSRAFIKNVQKHVNVTRIFDTNNPLFVKSLFKAMRPHQWMKNILVFVPLMSAHMYGNADSVKQVLLAFAVFCMASSSVYILNDLIDVADDRHHHRKRNRPFAAGNLSLLHGWLIWPILAITAFALAGMAMPSEFLLVMAGYYLLALAYSMFLKQKPMLDVMALAGLYTLRILAGAAAISVPLSFWLLSFSMFMFLSLAFIKRFSELKAARENGKEGMLRGRGYLHEDLEVVSAMGVAAGYLAVLILALYIQDSHTAEMYKSPTLIWLACPLLLYWISRAWLIAHRGEMHDDPIVFALTDKVSWVVSVCFVTIFGLARLVG